MTKTLRNYLQASEVTDYVNIATPIDTKELIKAERDIDKAVATFYQYAFRPSLHRFYTFDSAVFSSTTVFVADITHNDGFFSKTVIQVLDGSDNRFYVASQTNTTLNLLDSQTAVTGTKRIKIYQEAKFPMARDTEYKNNFYAKWIPEQVKEAVALQYAYRINNADKLTNNVLVTNWSTSESSYSESAGGSSESRTKLEDRIAPEALDILESMGISHKQQTI